MQTRSTKTDAASPAGEPSPEGHGPAPVQPSAPVRQSRHRISWRRKLAFSLVPITLLAAAGEIFARSFRVRQGYAPKGANSYRDHRIDLVRRAFPNVYDPLLGYRPKPGYSGRDNVWSKQVTIRADGLRSNGLRSDGLRSDGLRSDGHKSAAAPAARPDAGAVLAVGDSFTFGDQVSDHETWPARLEHELQRPVLNGGVFGYSFAQAVLRAEQLLETYSANPPAAGLGSESSASLARSVNLLVCSLIPDDLKRCELSRRYTPMPWFALVDGKLELRGVPVPDTSRNNQLDQQSVRRVLGYSALLDMLFWNACPSWWVGQERIVREHAPGTGLALGKLLLERLQHACRQHHVELVLVLQGQEPEFATGEPVRAPELLRHAESLGIATLDLATRFRSMADADPSLDARFFRGHMTAAGNAWVAKQIASRIRRL